MTGAVNSATMEELIPSSSGASSGHLAKGEDITHMVIGLPEKPLAAPLPSTSFSFQKASLISFQTWSLRNPGICGLLLGVESKNRRVCHSVVAGKDIEALLGNAKVDFACQSQKLNVYGIVLQGSPSVEEDRKLALEQLSLVSAKFPSAAACVLAPWI